MINFNTNLLETNVINLAFVVFVLVYFGGDVLNSLLDERLAIITKSLDEVETLKKTLEDIVVSPSVESLEADLKQKEVDLDLTIQKMRMEIKDRAKKEIQDLKLRQKAKIKFEEDKATSQLSEQIKNLTVQLAVLQIENRVLKARAELSLGLVSEYEQTVNYNQGKKFGYFFKSALKTLSEVKLDSKVA